jgi:hypothetical protein
MYNDICLPAHHAKSEQARGRNSLTARSERMTGYWKSRRLRERPRRVTAAAQSGNIAFQEQAQPLGPRPMLRSEQRSAPPSGDGIRVKFAQLGDEV